MTKGSGHMLFIADTTRERMRDPPDSLTLVGEVARSARARGQAARVDCCGRC